jgi:hypothetical protein
MSNLRFTIYEILGYLMPGIVGVAAIAVFYWSAFFPNHPIELANYSLSEEEIAALILTSYFIGHFIQGLCNYLPKPEALMESDKDSEGLIKNAREGMRGRCSLDLGKCKLYELTGAAETVMLQTGKTDTHDVYLYREGFYRGGCASFGLLSLALLFRATRIGASAAIGGKATPISSCLLASTSLLSVLIAIIFYRRYRRFAEYRIKNLLNFVRLPKSEHGKIEDTSKPEGNGE